MYNLPAAALTAALPLMRQRFAGWQPLEDPDRGLREMQRWRPLLQSDSARDAIFQVPACGWVSSASILRSIPMGWSPGLFSPQAQTM